MKVSGSELSHFPRRNHVDQFSSREFVLLTLDVGQTNSQASVFQPNDEQAAIVVKIPKRNSRNSIREGYLIDKRHSMPDAALKACLPEVELELNSRKKGSFVGVQDITATVILPSGVHSLPNKGEPSSLIQRWKSGGACDCGGWDMGCKLRILSNKSQYNQRPSSLKGSSTSNQFELFFQGGAHDKMPVFSLAPFSDGIYSVKFNSSLSLMQAFSICIAVWDSGNHCELSESVPSYEERTLGETMVNDRTSEPNPIEAAAGAPARYVLYPPVSPVGRV
ncbi:putative serine/threonine-protein kinase [Hibiscus syriacus]|uniref:Serine/threonine-protein kinase n=1 Tax=Hibiscus syriacus TaxID=106335 RepID=A0A6A2ZMT4_HIBSY|nr:putative serine/threonine-protein kinase [Hibiscus syriacus]